jgi:hypothetical protein
MALKVEEKIGKINKYGHEKYKKNIFVRKSLWRHPLGTQSKRKE